MTTITEPCLCGDPLCPTCFPQPNEAYGQAMQQSHADALAHRVECYLAFLEPDSIADQAKDPRIRLDREWQEQLLRDALARYRGD